ncbi:MAG: ribosome silencing factor [Atopobiaceae bacterium]|jgi:ribosome-associated protein|nr:ribosome silencing factor [Atopobiaceae bacterium]MCI2173155.1 ribosome silencing factor [Atopobiaceae bacterium]MCI2208248.1 ribosome silencing factor [Atopobiaceae bacterium]
MSVTPLELAKVAAGVADEKKASDILLLDLSDMSDVCDYFLIMTAANRRLCDAVVDAIEERVSLNCGLKPISEEGREDSSWVLLDYGPVVVHVFLPETREYYRLERLWGDAPRVELGFDGSVKEES